ncbi:hypothetical protein [Ralstonia sp. 1B3]|uniref:hypothetical protein n=1 Tax=Ralstonia sp. 1B3 TaxID=2997421 RepID=UPI002FC9C143
MIRPLTKIQGAIKGSTSKEKANPSRGWPCRLGWRPECLALSFDFPALDGALNFCCREEKEGRLSERSEFASPPSLQHKFKESFAISGAHFFAYFLWARPKKVSRPRQGVKQGMNQKRQNPSEQHPPGFSTTSKAQIALTPYLSR